MRRRGSRGPCQQRDLTFPNIGRLRSSLSFHFPLAQCQHFREHYIQFANQITTVAKENGFEVSVHAVSCEVHRSLCHDFGVHGYPKIMLFKAGEKNYTKEVPYYSIHPFQVLNDLGAHVDSLRLEQKDAAAPGGDGKGKKKVKQSTAEKGGDLEGGDAVTKKGQPRTKVDVFDDAYLSLVFALKNGVYMTNGPLSSNTTVKALKDWIDLLQVALPPAWNVQRMVAALKHDFDKIIQSEDQLVEVVDKFPPPSKTWSASCTHGEAGMGYTCGLWQVRAPEIVLMPVPVPVPVFLGGRSFSSSPNSRRVLDPVAAADLPPPPATAR